VAALLWADWPGVLSSGRIQLKEQQHKKATTKRAKQQKQNKNDKSETV
jgi:hypothetical protein